MWALSIGLDTTPTRGCVSWASIPRTVPATVLASTPLVSALLVLVTLAESAAAAFLEANAKSAFESKRIMGNGVVNPGGEFEC